ncbi:MAG TPA: BA14K family protein [Devosia sp.]|jgi:hypothetical protein|nr:BA14K family protein [Devosia sp.]
MSILGKSLAAMAMVSTIAVSSIIPAQAQILSQNKAPSYGQRDRVITSYCDRNPRDRDCRSYRRGGWHDSDYDRFYHSRRSGLDNIASGLFGFGFGAILGSAIANSNNNNDRVIGRADGYSAHVEACFNRYRSYDERTDSFMGYDGIRHRCNL